MYQWNTYRLPLNPPLLKASLPPHSKSNRSEASHPDGSRDFTLPFRLVAFQMLLFPLMPQWNTYMPSLNPPCCKASPLVPLNSNLHILWAGPPQLILQFCIAKQVNHPLLKASLLPHSKSNQSKASLPDWSRDFTLPFRLVEFQILPFPLIPWWNTYMPSLTLPCCKASPLLPLNSNLHILWASPPQLILQFCIAKQVSTLQKVTCLGCHIEILTGCHWLSLVWSLPSFHT